MNDPHITTKKGTGYKILHFPLTKILIGILVLAGMVFLGQILVNELFRQSGLERDFRNLISGLVTAALSLLSYYVLFRWYEKRSITELSTHKIFRNLGLGSLLGFVLQSLTILVMYFNGSFSILSVNPFLFLIPPFTMALTSAIFEEIFMRGIIFRILEEKLGSYTALIISALIFGGLHLANPNSSLLMALGLAIQAGLLLGLAYIFSRNLWFPIAIHFAWNFSQSGIYGANVSGNSLSKTLIVSRIEGPEWITGGAFGPEGSVQATVFCLGASIVLLMLSQKQNKLVKPFWKKPG